jgi:hypothetical protein
VKGDIDGAELQREKPTIGQKVWVITAPWHGKSKTIEGEVTKIGRKYVTIEWGEDVRYRSPVQFDMGTGYEKSAYSGNRCKYRTLAEKIEEDRRAIALTAIREGGLEPKGYGHCIIPTSKLEAVAEALADL